MCNLTLPLRRSLTIILLDHPHPCRPWNGATLGEAQAQTGCIGEDSDFQAQVSSVIGVISKYLPAYGSLWMSLALLSTLCNEATSPLSPAQSQAHETPVISSH